MADYRGTFGGAPPLHMLPLVAKGLEGLRGMAGPVPAGSPYPTAPTPYAGTSILSQRLDPSTVMLSNQPQPQMPAPPEQPAYPTPAAETYSTQQPGPTLRQTMAPPPTDWAYQAAIEGMNRSDARREYRGLDRLLQNPDWRDEDVLPTLSHLLNSGWLTVTADDFDTGVRLPKAHRERLIDLIDQYRPLLGPGGGRGYQREIQQAVPNPPSGVPMPTPDG